ncbi:hypothetical protein F3Y22_tig00110221pilonHSYRG00091 [Hibiscus syriacus]|uniref:DUF4218 domain-containing protein n=1 Tax=Hibiscus syriacus TaxID=106335 RepID=A0A6A3B7F8_HIBSY|nr:hypothetical protein F3Y22_tig00110221pilonHSYRG00091 [Hibiscus syriacus]
MCVCVYGTLLNLPAKTKDGLRARQDLEAMGIKPKIQTQPRWIHTWLPPACYTLNTTEKHRFYETLSTIKVPDGYCSNFKNLVSDDVSKMNSLKSNDCHVLIQQLLPFAIKGVLHMKVRKIIIEKYFLPSFFDVMIHLMVHLVREVRLCGPVHFRMLCGRGSLGILLRLLKNMKSIGNPHERVDERICTGKPLSRGTVEVVDAKLLDEAHLYVLQNTADVEPYIEQHMLELKDHNRCASRNSKWLQTQHSQTFISWPKTKVDTHFANGEDICESVRWLAKGPSFTVKKYSSFSINEYWFHTTSRDESRTTQCSGVSLVAHAMQIASAKDSNPVYGAVTYYGLVNFARLDHQSECFILTSQAKQVFYVQDQQDVNLSVVGFTPHKMYKYGANGETDDMLEYHATFDFSQDSPLVELDDDFLCTRPDGEGILVVLGTMESDQSLSHDEDSKQIEFIEKFKNDPNANLLNPPEMYPYLKINDWKVFVSQRLSKKWEMQETGKEEDEIYRSLLWKKARQMKKGGYDPNIQIVVDKMEEMQKSETLGEVSCGTNDMLTQALGTQEQRGRVRGMGKFVRPHQYFYLPNTVKNYLDDEKKKIEKRFNQIEGAIEKLQKGINHASEGASCQGWGKADFEDTHRVITCENIKVMMEMSVQGDVLLPFPLDEELIYKVKDAVGLLMKWPRHLVIRCSNLEEEKGEGTPKTKKEKEKEEGKGEGTLKRGKKKEKEEGTPQRRRTRAQMRTRLRVKSNRVMKVFTRMVDIQLKNVESVKVQCEDDMFGYESFMYITWEDFEVVFTVDEMSGSACPRQSGGTECGYYVCKFIKEIVENGLQVLINKNVGDGKEKYTDDDIDDIRKECVSYVANFIVP